MRMGETETRGHRLRVKYLRGTSSLIVESVEQAASKSDGAGFGFDSG